MKFKQNLQNDKGRVVKDSRWLKFWILADLLQSVYYFSCLQIKDFSWIHIQSWLIMQIKDRLP